MKVYDRLYKLSEVPQVEKEEIKTKYMEKQLFKEEVKSDFKKVKHSKSQSKLLIKRGYQDLYVKERLKQEKEIETQKQANIELKKKLEEGLKSSEKIRKKTVEKVKQKVVEHKIIHNEIKQELMQEDSKGKKALKAVFLSSNVASKEAMYGVGISKLNNKNDRTTITEPKKSKRAASIVDIQSMKQKNEENKKLNDQKKIEDLKLKQNLILQKMKLIKENQL